MYFYKYYKNENLSFLMLRDGAVYFPSVGELNDAHECRPRFVFNGSKELWIRLMHYILLEICFRYRVINKEDSKKIIALHEKLGNTLKCKVRNSDLGLERLSELIVESISDDLKVLFSARQNERIIQAIEDFVSFKLEGIMDDVRYMVSFTTCATNPTMWGHYANAEKGFVVVYKTNDGCVSVKSRLKNLNGFRPASGLVIELGMYDEERLELRRVLYGKRPPKINAFHRLCHKFHYSEQEDYYDVPALLGGEAQKKNEDKYGLVKFSDWKYEKELRAFFPTYENLPQDKRSLVIDKNQIKGIILGRKMSDADKERAIYCSQMMMSVGGDINPNESSEFIFFEARELADEFNLGIYPVGTLNMSSVLGLPLKKLSAHSELDQKRFYQMATELTGGSM